MGDSINSLSIAPIPTAFIDGEVIVKQVSGLMKIITGEVNVQPVASAELVGTVIINQEAFDLDGDLIVMAPIYKDIDGAITLNIARAEMDCWLEVFDEGGGWI